MRYNPYLTKQQSLATPRDAMYAVNIGLTTNSIVVDTHGHTMIMFMKQALPERLIAQLETTSRICAQRVTSRHLKGGGSKERGDHLNVRFGCTIMRGGTGEICVSVCNRELSDMISNNMQLWRHISDLF